MHRGRSQSQETSLIPAVPASLPHRPDLIASPFVHLAAYQFGTLSDLRPLRARLQELTRSLELKGTILLSHEGINLFVAGKSEALATLLDTIHALPGFESFDGKYNPCEHQPYNRMLVRLKKEIISFGVDGIDPARRTSPKLTPSQLKQWLDEGRPITLLDTRNDYEIKLGTFRNALTLPITRFRDFPAAVRQLPDELKQQPIVMFCTGGIRCEKAGPFMEQEGFNQIYQLEGGILKYFEDCAGAHYDGECFVFDQRTGVDPSLHETDATTCFHCQTPLTAEDQADPRYHPGISCPHCHRPPEQERLAALEARRAALKGIASPLPGSLPYDNYRPMTVPAECEGWALLPFLNHILPHIPESEWLGLWQKGCLIDDAHKVIPLDHPLRAGQRCLHRQPATVEPDVNANIGLIHEDEALIVIDKPAPLPMHPGGRFNRNTLQFFLHRAFHPFKPRPAHRLDANTTGVVVFTKTKHFASRLQPQFTRGEIEKIYLVRIHGQPIEERFECSAPISDSAGEIGSRSIDMENGLPARTQFEVLQRLADGTTLLHARPLTGRTNQIRLHLWHLGLPVLGDPTYLPGGIIGSQQTLVGDAPPLCLHSASITLTHPIQGQRVTFSSTPPIWAECDA